MNPYTASLVYRCHIRNACNYIQFIVNTDDITLKHWQGDYKVGDIKRWSDERIKSILAKAEQVRLFFADDENICSNVQNAVADYAEKLESVGYQLGSVQGVGTMRIEQMEMEL